jgi:antitoxin (DNA-binding transcriptional repressor) of toxin-antitoxin stability system
MKTISAETTTLDACVAEAQHDRVIVTREGQPVAIVVGIEGMDEEQIELGQSEAFWRLMAERRQERTIDRAELERRLAERDAREDSAS